jgi:hypothetical protein
MTTKSVKVAGEADVIWKVLEETLEAWRYEIVKSAPHTYLNAKRGSKALGVVMGVDTKGGYRDLNVSLAPVPESPDQLDVRFRFDFPSWTLGMPGAKHDCEEMVDDFAQKVRAAAASPATAKAAIACPKCKQSIPASAVFCPHCGEKTAAPASSTACPGCGAKLQANAAFCTSCGAKVSA